MRDAARLKRDRDRDHSRVVRVARDDGKICQEHEGGARQGRGTHFSGLGIVVPTAFCGATPALERA